ncbi:MAG TPA: hypothetical protein VNP97_14375 [Microbacterium sp.]|nr:hypothetical protein [Microbacterium sp.]
MPNKRETGTLNNRELHQAVRDVPQTRDRPRELRVAEYFGARTGELLTMLRTL